MTTLADKLLAAAAKYIGVKWTYSSFATTGINCITMVARSFKDAGIPIPTDTHVYPTIVPYIYDHWTGPKLAIQYANGKRITEIARGDIVIFGRMEHVGIAEDNNNCISALQPKVAIARTDTIRTVSVAAPSARYILRWADNVVAPPPPVDPHITRYEVQSGDTWIGVAKKFGVRRWQILMLANIPIVHLHPGQVLTIPG